MCTTYTGSYNGYFKDGNNNYYFITEGIGHTTLRAAAWSSIISTSNPYQGNTVISYTFNDWTTTRSSVKDQVDRFFLHDISYIDSVNAYVNIAGSITKNGVSGLYENWIGYEESIKFHSINDDGDDRYVVILPNNKIPAFNGHDNDQEAYVVYVDGNKHYTYNSNDDGTSIDTGSDDFNDYDEKDTYFIFKLKRLPCGMDASLVKDL